MSRERMSLKEAIKRFHDEEKKAKKNDFYSVKRTMPDQDIIKKYNKKLDEIWGKKDIDAFENEKDALVLLLDMAIYAIEKKNYKEGLEYLKLIKNGGYKVNN